MISAKILLYRFPEELARAWIERLRSFPVEVLISDTLEEGSPFDLGYRYVEEGGIPTPPSVSPWIAVVSEITFEIAEQAQNLGYLSTLTCDAPPWAIVEPLLRTRQRDRMIEELHRLLQESVEYHETLSILEEIRSLIPQLHSPRGYEQALKLYLGLTQAERGALWWREGGKKDSEDWFTLKSVTSPPPPSLFPESFPGHEILPHLTQGTPKLSLFLDDPPYTLLLILGRKEEPEGILYLYRSERFPHPHRLMETIKILNGWVPPLLSLAFSQKPLPSYDLQEEGEFLGRVEQLLKLSRRYERPLSIVSLWTPPETWQRYDLVGVISALLRESDILGNYDGEKISIALPETSYMGGEYFLRRLHRELRRRYPQVRLKITTTLATTPYHGLLLEDLLHYHKDEYRSLELLFPLFYPETPPARWLQLLTVTGKGIPIQDPNEWGDLLYTTLSELSLIHSRESRLCLYITDPEKFQKWFSSLNQAVLAWERVLLTADRPFPASAWGGVYGVDTGFTSPAYMILLDSPWGGLVALAEVKERGWQGGLFWEKGWARQLFDLWENRFMIHKRWLFG